MRTATQVREASDDRGGQAPAIRGPKLWCRAPIEHATHPLPPAVAVLGHDGLEHYQGAALPCYNLWPRGTEAVHDVVLEHARGPDGQLSRVIPTVRRKECVSVTPITSTSAGAGSPATNDWYCGVVGP